MSPRGGEGISDGAVLAAIGAVAAVAGTLWVWGGIAGAVFGSGWPSVGVGQLLGVLIRLPSRLSDPAGAWPAAVRPDLPGAGGFYAALAIVAGAGAGLVMLGGRIGGRLGDRVSGRLGGGGARWARTPELRPLHSFARSRRAGSSATQPRVVHPHPCVGVSEPRLESRAVVLDHERAATDAP